MNYDNIITAGNLIYQSSDSDKKLQEWRVAQYTCKVKFFQTVPLTDLENVLLRILKSLEWKKVTREEFGLTLGFDIATTTFDSKRFYEDKAEIKMFNSMISSLLKWKLIIEESDKEVNPIEDVIEQSLIESDKENNTIKYIRLTRLGELAIKYNCKFSFFEGNKLLYETISKSNNLEDTLFFPFYSELGIHSEITNVSPVTEYEGDDVDIEYVDDLIRRLRLQSCEELNIFCADKPSNRKLSSFYVDIRLFKYDGAFYPIVFHNDEVAEKASDVLYREENLDLLNRKIKKSLYCKLMSDADSIINYDEIKVFEDEIEKDEFEIIIKDKRTDWSDKETYNYIVSSEFCEENEWAIISEVCPSEIIISHIHDSNAHFEINQLSKRLPIDFILENIKSINWQLDIVMSRKDITIQQAQSIMLSGNNNDAEWDWDVTLPFLSLDFVLNNISNLSIDYYKLTSWLPEANLYLLTQYPERSWNWSLFVEKADVNLIIDKIHIIRDYVSALVEKILDRIFPDEQLTSKVIANKSFAAALRHCQSNDYLVSFNLEHKSQYKWDYHLIDFLESCDILVWNTTEYKKGFAQNKYINWSEQFFNRYNGKIVSSEDFSFISEVIPSLKIVVDNPNFHWDWEALSRNPNFASSEAFLELGQSKVDYKEWLRISQIVFSKDFFETHVQWMSSEANSEFVSSIIDDYKYVADYHTFPWNWVVLASNSKILNDERFTENLDFHKEAILIWLCNASPNLIEKNFFKLKVDELLASKLDYTYNVNLQNRFSTILSPKFISLNLKENWDIDIISNRIISELEESPNILSENKDRFNWLILSSGMNICFIQNHISDYIDKWDWCVLSERLDSEFIYDNFKSFIKYWDQNVIQRKIIPLLSAEDVLDESTDNYWDWNLISEDLSFSSLFDILLSKKELLNWRVISERICDIQDADFNQIIKRNSEVSDCLSWNIISNEISLPNIIRNKDVEYANWDWHIITSRCDTDFIVSNLSALANYWDWNIVLKNKLNREFLKTNLDRVKDSLNNLPNSKKDESWQTISQLYSSWELLTLSDELSPINGYFWDYSHVYQAIQDPEKFIEASHPYVDWSAFSSCPAVDRMFEFDSDTFTFRAWKATIKKKLNSTKFEWDYARLTRLHSIQERHDVFYEINKDKWDWEFISRYGSCLLVENNRDKYLRKYRDSLDFRLISQREDIGIDDELIESFIDENWDWDSLSSNTQTSITIKYICSHSEKEWNWNALSKNHSIKWTSQTLLRLIQDNDIKSSISWDDIVSRQEIIFDDKLLEQLNDVTFNWLSLTGNPSFHPSIASIKTAMNAGHEIDWRSISINQFINLDFVRQFKELLDWDILSANSKVIDVKKDAILNEFSDKLNWDYVSQKLELTTPVIVKYRGRLNWDIVNDRFDYNNIDLSLISVLENVVDWKKLSASSVVFTEEFLHQYRDKIDWYTFSKNESIDFTADLYSDFTHELNCVKFIDILEQGNSWRYESLKVYHFSHLFNAINIIKTRKILSRNKAEELNSLKYDAAGSVVHRTSKAHPFARFYYRPQSPTQFYNECLGWDNSLKTNWSKPKSYYPQACNLRLPKCPMPIFFEFDVREIIAKMSDKCYYSTGNLQTNYASVVKVEETPDRIRTTYLYKDMSDAFGMACRASYYDPAEHHYYLNCIKEESQQEFLVIDEFDFSQLESFSIYCFDEFQRNLLIQLLGDDEIISKIKVGGYNMYSRNNRQLSMWEDENSITISSDYDIEGCAYLLVKGGTIINRNDVRNMTAAGSIIYPTVTFDKNNPPTEVYFIDPNPMAGTKEWLIYSSSMIAPRKSSKFNLGETIRKHVEAFLPFIETLPIKLTKQLFYPHMIDSYHGVAHTARVVFNAYLLSSNMSEEEKTASCIAAIIHDLGKQNDRDGAIHGYNSMLLYKDKINNLVENEAIANRILNAVRYHSIEDRDCPSDIRRDYIWKLLKDADALDRSRFFGKGCDKSYLRLDIYNTPVGEIIFNLSAYMPNWTKNLDWNDPYKELIEQIHKYCE